MSIKIPNKEATLIQSKEAKEIYQKIQEKLFYLIPEKWDSLYLYASVTEQFNKLESGEMFFYYFPKGILKRNPVNSYAIPNKFNIDEAGYMKLLEELYGVIKQLKELFIIHNQKVWSNLTITIEDFKFCIEYDYENLKLSQYSNYDRHIIWRYIYLKTDIHTYNKKERNMILEYMKNVQFKKEQKETYTEPMYKRPVRNIIDYNKQDEYDTGTVTPVQTNKPIEDHIKEEASPEDAPQIKNQILMFKK